MLRDSEITWLEQVIERSKERRKGFFGFGPYKTSKAEAAEIVMVAYFPALLAEIKADRMVKQQLKQTA